MSVQAALMWLFMTASPETSIAKIPASSSIPTELLARQQYLAAPCRRALLFTCRHDGNFLFSAVPRSFELRLSTCVELMKFVFPWHAGLSKDRQLLPWVVCTRWGLQRCSPFAKGGSYLFSEACRFRFRKGQ